MIKSWAWVLCVFLVGNGSVAFSQSTAKSAPKPKQDKEIKFEGSKIEGEREKPRDLYILPWQGTMPAEGEGLRLDILGSVDLYRDRFDLQRDLMYFERTGERVF